MKSRLNLWILATSLTLAPITPAHAQYTNPYTGRTWNNPNSSLIDTMILHNQQSMMLRNSLIGNMAIQQSLTRRAPKLTKAQKREVDRYAKYRGTMFKPGKPFMPARIAAVFVSTPGEQRDDMTKLFEGLLKFYNTRSKQQGAPANDLARTLSYTIALNYAYAREQEVSNAGMTAMRAKLRNALLASPDFRKMSEQQKQEMHETLVILSHFVAVGYDQSKEKGDKDSMAAFKKLANFNLQTLLKVDPSRIRLEKDGLVIT